MLHCFCVLQPADRAVCVLRFWDGTERHLQLAKAMQLVQLIAEFDSSVAKKLAAGSSLIGRRSSGQLWSSQRPDVNDSPSVACNVVPREVVDLAFPEYMGSFLVFKSFGDLVILSVASDDENGLVLYDFFTIYLRIATISWKSVSDSEPNYVAFYETMNEIADEMVMGGALVETHMPTIMKILAESHERRESEGSGLLAIEKAAKSLGRGLWARFHHQS